MVSKQFFNSKTIYLQAVHVGRSCPSSEAVSSLQATRTTQYHEQGIRMEPAVEA